MLAGMSPLQAQNPHENEEPGGGLTSGEPPEPAEGESAGVDNLLTEIDHIAIAVRDLGDAIDYYRETFGAVVDHREVVESDGVEEALLKVAESYIQLLTPTHDGSPVARYIERRGEGLHHVGYRVADCAVALQAVKDSGGRVLDDKPRPGSRGTTVAFIHPKTAFGTLIELVQE
jgi:methylmalonyl-CoA/ethylmalonyl-CoA epimerase